MDRREFLKLIGVGPLGIWISKLLGQEKGPVKGRQVVDDPGTSWPTGVYYREFLDPDGNWTLKVPWEDG